MMLPVPKLLDRISLLQTVIDGLQKEKDQIISSCKHEWDDLFDLPYSKETHYWKQTCRQCGNIQEIRRDNRHGTLDNLYNLFADESRWSKKCHLAQNADGKECNPREGGVVFSLLGGMCFVPLSDADYMKIMDIVNDDFGFIAFFNANENTTITDIRRVIDLARK